MKDCLAIGYILKNYSDMKKTVITLTAAVLSAIMSFAQEQASSSGPASARDTLKVMTYNLRFGELASMADIAGFISSETPDIVALQECDWATYRERAPKQNGVRFINELAYRTGMFGLYGKSIDYKQGYYGIGILSRYPVVRSERIRLPDCNGMEGKKQTEPRIMLLAEIELPSGRHVTFVCTHLEVSSSEVRVMQSQFINERLEDISPALIAGDFNATPDSPAIAEIQKKWKNLTGPDFTISSDNPVKKIDYIFGKPQGQVEMLSTRTFTDVRLSDHRPIISTVIF